VKTSQLRVARADLHERVLPVLRGRVFHVTCRARVPALIARGGIEPNAVGTLPTAFGSATNSYFRLRDAVSVFDYRTVDEVGLKTALESCSPFDAARNCMWELSIFFLAPRAYQRLRSWEEWRTEQAWAEMVVPHVEAGHPGRIALADVDERLDVYIDHTPSPFEQALDLRARLKPRLDTD
jgi:hypothetical protein